MMESKPDSCTNCGTQLTGEYCHQCGQSSLPIPTDFFGFLRQVLSGIAGTDFRLLRTLRHLALSPGMLTREWTQGRHSSYTAPVQLYLFIAALFFLVNAYHPFVRFHPENMTLTSSLSGILVANDFKPEFLETLAVRGMTPEVFKEKFEADVSTGLAPLLIFVVLLFSLLVALVMRRSRQPYAVHAVFALHWCSFYLLIEGIHRFIGAGKVGETVVTLLGLAYLTWAVARVYGMRVRAFFAAFFLQLGFLAFLSLWIVAVSRLALP